MTRAKGRVRIGPNEQRESDECPAQRHRHSRRGWYEDGCRCPSTAAAHERKLAAAAARNEMRAEERAKRQAEAEAERQRQLGLPLAERYREIDDCPAGQHYTPGEARWKAWHRGCRCPSVVKAKEARLENMRQTARRYRQRKAERVKHSGQVASFNLSRAVRRDAEAIAMGYRTGKTDRHTIGMAVHLMLMANPYLTARQIHWRLENAGQGPTSERQVQRIISALQIKRERMGLPPLDRSGLTVP